MMIVILPNNNNLPLLSALSSPFGLTSLMSSCRDLAACIAASFNFLIVAAPSYYKYANKAYVMHVMIMFTGCATSFFHNSKIKMEAAAKKTILNNNNVPLVSFDSSLSVLATCFAVFFVLLPCTRIALERKRKRKKKKKKRKETNEHAFLQ